MFSRKPSYYRKFITYPEGELVSVIRLSPHVNNNDERLVSARCRAEDTSGSQVRLCTATQEEWDAWVDSTLAKSKELAQLVKRNG